MVSHAWGKGSGQEQYWHKRSHVKWLKYGYSNSKFFHLFMTIIRRKNRILRIKGVMVLGVNRIRMSAKFLVSFIRTCLLRLVQEIGDQFSIVLREWSLIR